MRTAIERLQRAVLLVLAIGDVGAAVAQRPRTVPGTVYAMRVTSEPSGAMGGVTGGADSRSFTGRASVITSRGRLDIVAGGIESLFAKGDYLLFDSTEVVVVRPSQQEFVIISTEVMNAAGDRLAGSGIGITLSDERVALDSLGAGDTIAGVPTRRYRMTLAFNMSVDAAFMRSRLGSESTTEYWVGDVSGMPPNPLLRLNGLSGGTGIPAVFKSLGTRVDSAARRMGRSVALRTISTTRINAGPGQVFETHQSSEISDMHPAEIDPSMLVVPAAYKVATPPGLSGPATTDGSRWKALPAPSRRSVVAPPPLRRDRGR